MKRFLKGRWVTPVAALVLTLSIGTAAFAVTGSSSTDASGNSTGTAATAPVATPRGATATNPWGNQRSDETLLTDPTLSQVKEAALTKVGSDATIVRIETDADGHAAYEAHVVKADGTPVTVFVDKSFAVVSVEDQPAGGPSGGRHGGPAGGARCPAGDADAAGANSKTDTTGTSLN